MSEINPIEFGELRAKVDQLETQVAEMQTDVKALLALANRGRGGIMTLWAVGGAITGVLGWIGIERILK